ncbi:uncharacterized protein LOC133202965 [Saccostrea echinata]|uniref:uncharacterized protein LOC133202965 n=1 Tax=Saccostrea echinata TaxID=191078 RepID=UPI002A83EF60|nr:uncharacterized protein LOC133202965 [Saccostrea echinata]
MQQTRHRVESWSGSETGSIAGIALRWLNCYSFFFTFKQVSPAAAKNTLEIKGERSEKNICPSLSGWEGRSKTLCYWDESLYHCLRTRAGWYLEVCTKPIDVEPGHYPEISEEFDRLNIVPCPTERYQPEGALSNQFKKVTCEYSKTKCNGFGENYCTQGTTTKDLECKCDYLRGYRSLEYLLNNPLNKSCYSKKDVGGGCVMYGCTNAGEELNPAYQCVKKCDPGFYRPPDEFNCIQNKTTSTRPATTPYSGTTSPATAETETPTTILVPVKSAPPKSPVTSTVEKWKIAGYVTLAVVALVIITLVVYFFLEKFFKIHMKQPSIITPSFKDDVTLEAYVPGFSWFNIEFQWSRIKGEDINHEEEEIQTDGEQSHFLIRTEGCTSSLTISQVTVQLEAEYVCRANLKCWSRIADKTSTTLYVKGGQFYTPQPSPLPSPPADKKQEDKKFPNVNGLYAPKATMDTDDEHDNKPIIAGTYIKEIHIHKGKNFAIGDKSTLVVTYDAKNKKKKKSKRKKKKEEESDDDSSCSSDTPLVEPTKPVSNLQRELKNLDLLAQKSQYKLKVLDVPGDGHCLYHAFSQSDDMHGLPDDPTVLRRKLVKYLESNPNTPDGVPYKDFLCLPLDPDHGVLQPEDMAIERVQDQEDQKELRWQRFLKKIQDGEWGGSLEIMGLAQLFNVPVTVLSVGMNGFRLNEISFNHTNETSPNPVVYIGHLKVRGKGVHFVSFRPLQEKAIEQPTSMQHGELHRKAIDSSYPYKDGKVIVDHELDKRIGCIEITAKRRSNGTGFRVGSKYVMTAFHVMEDVLVPFWKQVYSRLKDEERRPLRWTAENVPVDGRWNLSILITSLDPSIQGTLIKIADEMITKSSLIKFGFVDGKSDTKSVLGFSYDVAFVSQKHDVVILELNEDTNLPPPLILKDTNIPGVKLHVIGHPKGIELQHDPGCKIIEDQAELTELVNKGIDFFTGLGYKIDQVKEDYAPCVLSSDHILFHCSESTAHGASGSPLIVIKEKPQVTGMLLKGHPHLYYNYSSGKEDHPELLVESGISMEKVHSLLIEHSLIQLAEELFSQNL